MLAILTGTRQVGKTRWLERFIEEATDVGLNCVGLVSPGRWVKTPDGGFEKTGIRAVLLPQNEEFLYAVRPDLAQGEAGQFSQSQEVQLGWKIFDTSIQRINDHFDSLIARGLKPKDVLIIDEIGPLELIHGKGFTSALALLDSPQSNSIAGTMDEIASASIDENVAPTAPNAVIIMRPELLQETIKRLTPVWGEPLVIDVSTEGDYRGIESLIKSFSSASDNS